MSAQIARIEDHPLTPSQARSHRLALRLVMPLVILLAVIVVPLYGLYDYSKVSGPSMLNTLKHGEYLLITRGLPSPTRGDIVVLTLRYTDGTSEEIVKRIVGLPGDTISVRGDLATVNGSVEPWAGRVLRSNATKPVIDTVVAPGHVFLMGDNRPVSDDSRYIGEQPLGQIHGRVLAVWAPFDRMRLVR